MPPRLAAFLADAMLVLHFALVAFIGGGLALVWAGRRRGWAWVRNGWFRLAHATAMGVVLLIVMLGEMCPLTVWEAQLRERAGQDAAGGEGFIAYWVHRVLYLDLPPGFFVAAYVAFFTLIVWTARAVPARWPWRR
jgi:hypothetical protein